MRLFVITSLLFIASTGCLGPEPCGAPPPIVQTFPIADDAGTAGSGGFGDGDAGAKPNCADFCRAHGAAAEECRFVTLADAGGQRAVECTERFYCE